MLINCDVVRYSNQRPAGPADLSINERAPLSENSRQGVLVLPLDVCHAEWSELHSRRQFGRVFVQAMRELTGNPTDRLWKNLITCRL